MVCPSLNAGFDSERAGRAKGTVRSGLGLALAGAVVGSGSVAAKEYPHRWHPPASGGFCVPQREQTLIRGTYSYGRKRAAPMIEEPDAASEAGLCKVFGRTRWIGLEVEPN